MRLRTELPQLLSRASFPTEEKTRKDKLWETTKKFSAEKIDEVVLNKWLFAKKYDRTEPAVATRTMPTYYLVQLK